LNWKRCLNGRDRDRWNNEKVRIIDFGADVNRKLGNVMEVSSLLASPAILITQKHNRLKLI